jgi:general secretion pathway protein A
VEIPYIEYFGLTEKPFGLSPDPYFYFEAETHREAMDHLRFFLSQREGFALIHGDVGLGKTTISRIFLNSLDKSVYNTALILNPIMDEIGFLMEVSKELGIKPLEGSTKKVLFDGIEGFLLGEYQKGRETVLAIDEAQLLSNELLELIRILSNIETEKEKILRIILFAQPELLGQLMRPEMRHLAQRITVTYRLRPFAEKEVGLYIAFRLIKAGSTGYPQFRKRAVGLIYEASRGYPRLVNILSDRCLLDAYAKSKKSVGNGVVRDVLGEEHLALSSVKGSQPVLRRPFVVALITVTIFGLLCLAAGVLHLWPTIYRLLPTR